MNPLAVGGDAGCDAEAGLRTQGLAEGIEEFLVAIGCLDEELCLMLAHGAFLQLLQASHAVGGVDGQVAVEGEALSVEAGCHHRHDHGGRAYEGYHAEAFALGDGHHIGPRVGHGRAARL